MKDRLQNVVWRIGVAHGMIGGAIFISTLHPLRDALDDHALRLVTIAAAWQMFQGLAMMLVASAGANRIAGLLIGAGALLSCGMVYVIGFTGAHPFDPAVPLGGAITLLGWGALLLRGLR